MSPNSAFSLQSSDTVSRETAMATGLKNHSSDHQRLYCGSHSSPSSDNGADSISSNIAPRVNKHKCIEKAVQQTMKSNFIKTQCSADDKNKM